MDTNEKGRLTIIDEEGKEQECEVLFTFNSEIFNKSYVIYYPVGEEDNDEIEVMASAFTEDEGGISGKLLAIETDEEWEMIEEVLETFAEESEEQ